MILVILLGISLLLLVLVPVKFAKKIELLEQNKNYVLVSLDYVSGFEFLMIGDNSTKDGLNENIHITGNFPSADSFNDDLYYVDNRNIFLCYGEFQNEKTSPYGVEGRTFIVDEWEILYPIQRRNYRVIPFIDDNVLTIFDVNPSKK